MSDVRRRGIAETAAGAPDPALRGRTYAVPFEDVWQASLRLAGGLIRRWTLHSADDQSGVIEAHVQRVFGATFTIAITIRLDEDAQTRVDARAIAHRPGTDLGTTARLVRRYFHALDQALARLPRRDRATRM